MDIGIGKVLVDLIVVFINIFLSKTYEELSLILVPVHIVKVSEGEEKR